MAIFERIRRRKKTEDVRTENLKNACVACQKIAGLKNNLGKSADTVRHCVKDNEDVLEECLGDRGFEPKSNNATNSVVTGLKKQYAELKKVRDEINTHLETINNNLHIDENTN